MNLSRLSKKVPHTDSRKTLIGMHEQILEQFKEDYKNIPEKKRLLKDLLYQYNNDCCVDKHAVYKSILELQKELKILMNREDEMNYLTKAFPYLIEYYEEEKKYSEFIKNGASVEDVGDDQSCSSEEEEIKDVKDNCTLNRFIDNSFSCKKAELRDNYIKEVIYKSHSKKNSNSLRCESCNSNLIVIDKEAAASCPTCGIQVMYNDVNNTKEFIEEIEMKTQFSYKKINHFKEWLATLQGKASYVVEDKVIELLLMELKKERITDPKDITPERIKKYLKKLNLIKQKEHINAIISRLCGRKPPTISKDLENKLIQMFGEIQIPFKNVCPAGRKNFMSYSYTFHKMVQLLGEDELLEYFPLLKSRDKLYFQDKIWKGICDQLKLEFIPSI